MNEYFLHNGTDQEGPYTIEDLKAKNIKKTTPIWYAGLPKWTIAGNVPELAILFKQTPPPFEAPKTAIPPAQRATASKNVEQPVLQEKTNSNKVILTFALLVAIVGIGSAVFFNLNRGRGTHAYGLDTQSYQEKVMTVEEIERSEPIRFLTADGTYNHTLFGNDIKVHGVIKNIATVASYKDAVVQVTYYSKTNTVLRKNSYSIYEEFPPHSETKFEIRIDSYDNVSTIGWDVIRATPN